MVNEDDDADSEAEWGDIQTDSDDDDVIDETEENQVGDNFSLFSILCDQKEKYCLTYTYKKHRSHCHRSRNTTAKFLVVMSNHHRKIVVLLS